MHCHDDTQRRQARAPTDAGAAAHSCSSSPHRCSYARTPNHTAGRRGTVLRSGRLLHTESAAARQMQPTRERERRTWTRVHDQSTKEAIRWTSRRSCEAATRGPLVAARRFSLSQGESVEGPATLHADVWTRVTHTEVHAPIRRHSAQCAAHPPLAVAKASSAAHVGCNLRCRILRSYHTRDGWLTTFGTGENDGTVRRRARASLATGRRRAAPRHPVATSRLLPRESSPRLPKVGAAACGDASNCRFAASCCLILVAWWPAQAAPAGPRARHPI